MRITHIPSTKFVQFRQIIHIPLHETYAEHADDLQIPPCETYMSDLDHTDPTHRNVHVKSRSYTSFRAYMI